MEKLKNFMIKLNSILFEKNGVLKIIGACALSIISLLIYQKTEWDVFADIFFISVTYLGLSLFMIFLYAFVINPINSFIQRRKEKKETQK
jgi:hypothetical protein